MNLAYAKAERACLGCSEFVSVLQSCDGLCYECHPVIVPDQDRSNRGYVSPDQIERNGGYYDHRDDAARNRVVDNTGWA